MSGKSQISAQNFFRRVKHLYSQWKDPKKEHKDLDAIYIPNGKDDETSIKVKTTAVYIWLLGQELIDTLIMLTKKSVIVVANQTQISALEHFNNEKAGFDLNLELITRDDHGNQAIFDKIKETLSSDGKASGFKLGKLVKEKQSGPFVNEFEKFVDELQPEFVEIGNLIQESLCIKESEELEIIKKAGGIAVWFQSKLISQVEDIIDNEKRTKHSDISKEIDKLLTKEDEMKQLESTQKVEKKYVDLAYLPIIQSGGTYDLRPQAESTDEILSYDTIICSVGSKYHDYNCNIVRTLFIDPDNEQKQNYNIANEVHSQIISKLKSGTSLKSIYDSALEYVKSKKPGLQGNLPTSFGYGIGLEFRETNLAINAKNERTIEAGMVFNISVSLNGLKAKNGNSYAIMLSDSVIVRAQGPEVITSKIPRKYEEISYSLKGEEEVQETVRPSNQNQSAPSKRSRTDNTKSEHDEAKRKEHQKELQKQKVQELEDRIASGGIGVDKTKQKIETEKIVTYKQPADVPKDMKKNQIYVDMKNDAVVLPIFGQMVPFHINVIKNVAKQEEEGKKVVSLRLNFHVPVAQAGSNVSFPENTPPETAFIRELTFRSKNLKNAADVVKKIKDLQKKIKDKANDEKNIAWDPESDPLILIKGKRPTLQDLKVRPNISGKKSSGTLEAHANGFRFTTKKGEKLDVTFRNIKHAFFQPCQQELIILLHFHLYKPIMIGKKRSYDVQFYTEAGLQAEDLDMRRRGNDDDEMEQEERERAQRKKLDEEFELFTKAVEAAAKDQIEFDIPYRDLGFQGAPAKASVNLYPTVHCLVNLTETPFFIMTLDEVEIAHFERIQFGLRNFDLTFVYKDYSKPPTRISAIPITYVESIKNWLDKMDIIFSDSRVNLDWTKVMQEVREQIKHNPKEFLEEGGWNFLQPGSSDQSEADEADEVDSAFEAEEDANETESDYSEGDDEDESDFDEDEEEEGMSWDEMEDLAEEEDEERDTKRKPNKQVKPPVKKVKK